MSKFPIDLSKYVPLKIDPWTQEKLTSEQRQAWSANIQLFRDAVVFFTACGAAGGYGGHTGGAYDTTPETTLMDAFFRGRPDKFVPIFFDEAGHRVATQYLFSVLHGHMPAERLMDYRKGHAGLPGHPELGLTPGVQFSSGRLGHIWPYVNGVAMANPDKVVFVLGSDGSQQEGNSAEAARLAVAQKLNVKLLVDDNDVTIYGHPSEYMIGYKVAKTLAGHGLSVHETKGEDLDALYATIRNAVVSPGPHAVVSHRKMAPGIKGLEGHIEGHDVIPVKLAIPYLESRGLTAAVETLKSLKGSAKDPISSYIGAGALASNRVTFGTAVADILDRMSPAERKNVMAIDCDLASSTGLDAINKRHPQVFVRGGIMERGNLSAAAGFGRTKGKQGIFSTFAAFLEMCVSEITMARMNDSNLLCHFSHSGVDDIADNTCHFGINSYFADGGFDDQCPTRLYFPADAGQVTAVVERIFFEPGMRFIFTTRSKTPQILDETGKPLYGKGYKFQPGRDEVVREGTQGYLVTFGDAVYRCVDASEKLKKQGVSIGVINKCSLNVIDEAMLQKLSKGLVLVVEPFNVKTGLGIRMGSWFLERGFTPKKYGHIGTHREGCGGLWEQAYHQGYDPSSIIKHVTTMLSVKANL